MQDSFASLPLDSLVFSKMFNAQWLWCAPTLLSSNATGSTCYQIDDAATFAKWINAWIENGGGVSGILKTALLQDERVHIWNGFCPDKQLNGGPTAYLSAHVVGITNLFESPRQLLGAVAEAIDKPLVCYERGTVLNWDVKHGFEPISILTVWARRPFQLA